MKRLFFIVCVLLFCPSLWAEEINAMLLKFTSGMSVVFQLDEQPVMTFEGDELVLTTHMSRVSYEAKAVAGFSYTYVDPADIGIKGMPKCILQLENNMLIATGLEPKSLIEVYDIEGRFVASEVTDGNGSVKLMLPILRGALYVVKTSVANFKISRI